MSDAASSSRPEFSRPVPAKLLSGAAEIPVRETATDAEKAALAELFDAQEVRKFRIAGTLRPAGKGSWTLDATLTATLVQTCVVTLEPVVTTLSEPVQRRWIPGGEPMTGEITVDSESDEDVDDLDDGVDIGQVATEAAALALPPYPRAADAPEIAPAEPEEEVEKPRPFAALAELKAKLEDKG
ncbi:MAG: YceD family protein [Pseudomonadota bacterium]